MTDKANYDVKQSMNESNKADKKRNKNTDHPRVN